MKLIWTHTHACNSRGTGFLSFCFIQWTCIYTAIILQSFVIGVSKTSHVNWTTQIEMVFSLSTMWNRGCCFQSAVFWPWNVYILIYKKLKKNEICQTNDSLRGGCSSPTVGKSCGLFSPQSNDTGDECVSKDDLIISSPEVWPFLLLQYIHIGSKHPHNSLSDCCSSLIPVFI